MSLNATQVTNEAAELKTCESLLKKIISGTDFGVNSLDFKEIKREIIVFKAVHNLCLFNERVSSSYVYYIVNRCAAVTEKFTLSSYTHTHTHAHTQI